jgi:hypothetical protein
MSSTTKTNRSFFNVVKAMIPFVKKKGQKPRVLAANPLENMERIQKERDISKSPQHTRMAEEQLERLHGFKLLSSSAGARKRKQPNKPKTKTKKKPASKTKKSTKK